MTLKVNTSGYGGRTLRKKATVFTNDSKRPVLRLTITGAVKRFAEIHPKRIYLSGYGSDPIRGVVAIVPTDDNPFKIVNAKAKIGRDIRIELKGPSHKGYELHVENLKKSKGRYTDTIQLRTDSKIKPLLVVRVIGNIKTKPSLEKNERAGDTVAPNQTGSEHVDKKK